MNGLKNGKEKGNIIIFFPLHILLCVFSLSGLFSKLASGEPFLSISFFFYYGGVILILGIYAICWQQIIKRMPLSLAYANKAITIIWGMIWGILIFKEQIRIQQIIGAVIVISGVVLYSMENRYERD